MRNCGICGGELLLDANLCTTCADALDRPAGFCAEQLLSTSLNPTNAALIDSWGRVHLLEDLTPIGRRPVARGTAILEASVSRNHAELSRDLQGRWQLRDAGSSNGTWVDGERISAPVMLDKTRKLSFGSVGLYFVISADAFTLGEVVASTATIRPEDALEFGQDELDEPVQPTEATFAGFPKLAIQFFQPSAGGGGLVDLAGTRLQVTAAQYELVRLLAARMREETGVPIEVRGFCPSSQLLAELPWDTPYPVENHLKQLIRRVRKLLEAENFGNLIESRRGFGYRLRCIPIDAPSA